MNQVLLSGKVSAYPDFRANPQGGHYVKLTLAVTRPKKDENGEWQKDKVYVIAWDKLALEVEQSVVEGSLVRVEGFNSGGYTVATAIRALTTPQEMAEADPEEWEDRADEVHGQQQKLDL